jgi:hypothetical protein
MSQNDFLHCTDEVQYVRNFIYREQYIGSVRCDVAAPLSGGSVLCSMTLIDLYSRPLVFVIDWE